MTDSKKNPSIICDHNHGNITGDDSNVVEEHDLYYDQYEIKLGEKNSELKRFRKWFSDMGWYTSLIPFCFISIFRMKQVHILILITIAFCRSFWRSCHKIRFKSSKIILSGFKFSWGWKISGIVSFSKYFTEKIFRFTIA